MKKNKILIYLILYIYVFFLMIIAITNSEKVLFACICMGIIAYIGSAIYMIYLSYFKRYIAKELNFEEAKRKLPKEIEYYREIPCKKNIEKSYWILYHYSKIKTKDLKQGVIGAYILTWIKDEKVIADKDGSNDKINLGDGKWQKTNPEEQLYNIFKSIAGENNILEKNEFKKWCKKNKRKINEWFQELIKYETEELEKEGLIKDNSKEYESRKYKTKIVSKELREDAIRLLGLKRFLLDFSLMPEREYIEVHLWEEYLIFAELMGISDKVNEQFSKLYPDFSIKSKISNLTFKDMGEIYASIKLIQLMSLIVAMFSSTIIVGMILTVGYIIKLIK